MARKLTKQSKSEEPLCLQRRDRPVLLKFDIKARRQRIADIHNEVRQFVPACDYVLRVEDDTVVPPLTFDRLLAAYSLHPFAGFVEGVELGAGAGTGRQPWARLHAEGHAQHCGSSADYVAAHSDVFTEALAT